VVARPEHKDEGDAVRVEFAKLDDPDAVLREWLALVREARCRPLPFVYEVGRRYADECVEAKPGADPEVIHNAAKREASKEFASEFGAQNDPYIKLVYPDIDALLAPSDRFGFRSITRALFDPFFTCRRRA